jgi:hypothetical protein
MFDLHKPKTPQVIEMKPKIKIESDFEEWYQKLISEAARKGPRTLTVRRMDLTPEFAAVALTHNGKNRKPAGPTVVKYVDRMKRGEWELTFELLAVDWNGNIQEGGHRLTACATSGITIPVYMGFGADPATFDVIGQGKTRSAGDVLQIEGVANCNQIAALYRLIYLYDTGSKTYNVKDLTHRDIATYVAVHNDEMQASLVSQRMALKNKLPRTPVFAAAHYCIARQVEGLKDWLVTEGYSASEIQLMLQRKREGVDKWFERLTTGFGITGKEDATHWLRKKLLEDSIRSHAYGPPRLEAVFTFINRGWNAFSSHQRPLKNFHYKAGDSIPRIAPAKEWVNI